MPDMKSSSLFKWLKSKVHVKCNGSPGFDIQMLKNGEKTLNSYVNILYNLWVELSVEFVILREFSSFWFE